MILTEESLRDVCLTKKLYRTPAVNDKLWLHYMGISKLENLEAYTVRTHWPVSSFLSCLPPADPSLASYHHPWQGIKVAWLEGNGKFGPHSAALCVL
jgi:hypothetical protein